MTTVQPKGDSRRVRPEGQAGAGGSGLCAGPGDLLPERPEEVLEERDGALVDLVALVVEPLVREEDDDLGLDHDVGVRPDEHLPKRELRPDRAEVGRSGAEDRRRLPLQRQPLSRWSASPAGSR
ncbi:hypothetical protein ACFV1W_28710 [Kitasatospora sp. NPDC059648]|uniref:hypothetical protein n=1 Tax=Kitasatospora sp. NPDC059648 TaxID=3346894 RepID=UPI0036AE08C5